VARCFIAVAWALVAAGCNFHVLALPIEDGTPSTADLATTSSDVDLGTTPGDVDLALTLPPPPPPVDLAAPLDLATTTGALTGTRAPVPPGAIDLTAEGGTDWAHYGLSAATDVDHKDAVTPMIALAATGQPLQQYGAYVPKFKWSDGTPTAKANNITSGVYVHGANSAITFTVPADTTSRSLRLYLTHFNSTARLVAHLSDGSAPDFTGTVTTGVNTYYRVTLTFRAASAGQTLTVGWTLQNDAGNGSVDALAATLF
jgi:hypothetical protein